LEDYDSRQPTPTIFWFDIFSNNQHKASNREFTWWQTVFRDNIGKLKRTLLVLEWDDPKPLSRAWCLWEMVSTVDTKSEFHVLMSPKNHESFAAALVNDFKGIVFKTCNVDLKNAEAFNPSDRDNIFKAVEATVGFEEVNMQVIGIMKEWMAKSGKEVLLALPVEDRPLSQLQTMLGRVLKDQGKMSEAEPLLSAAVEVKRRTLRVTHPDTLSSLDSLRVLLKAQGKLDEAEPLLRENLEVRRRTLGDAHPDTLTSINNFGMLLLDQGKFHEAEPLLREALEVRRRALGNTHSDTLTSVRNMALVFLKQDNLTEAEPLFREALEGRSHTLGDSHPDTLVSINNLGLLLEAQGKLSEAEPLFQKALKGRRRTLGETHPQTLTTRSNLGMLLQDQGKLSEAEQLYREALDVRRRTLGDTHPAHEGGSDRREAGPRRFTPEYPPVPK